MKAIWLFLVGISILALGSTTGVIYADGGDESLIHACVKKKGKVRIVGPNDLCKKKEAPKHWTIAGLLGPQGPKGDDGPEGPEGPQGPPASGGGVFEAARGEALAGEIRYSISASGNILNEEDAQIPIPRDGELLSLADNPISNTLDGDAVITVRLNAVETALKIVVPSSSTGVM